MLVRELTDRDLPQVIRLIQKQMATVPPGITPTAGEAAAIIQDPMHHMMLDPDPGASHHTPCLVGMVGDTVVSAMQLLLAPAPSPAYALWMVALQDRDLTSAFIMEVLSRLRHDSRSSLQFTRNPFAPGWSGIADSWDHLWVPLQEAPCVTTTDPWVIYWCTEDRLIPVEAEAGYTFTTRPPDTNRGLQIVLSATGEPVAEAEIWLPSPRYASLVQAGVADLEWIEVSQAQRRKGLGGVMLSAAMREASQRGFHALVLWAGVDNQAMQRLARKSGFSKGPVLHWATLQFDEAAD